MREKNQKIEQVLSRRVVEILPSKKGLKNLIQKRKIRLYLGIDPTSPQIHLGNAICLKKLKEFQDLGHEVIFLIGTFTAQIGDPSGRDKKREPLTPAQIKENMAGYLTQAAKIIDISKVKIKHNSDWLEKLNLKDLIKLTSYFTTSQLLERDMFQERFKKRREVWLSELLYPLMQGYDSVAMNVDLEIGGTDQTFNMLVGRKLQKIYNKKEKFVLTIPLLIGLDGRKMSKSYGNVVNIADPPNDMYGKLMSLKDNLITHYFELCTDIPINKIKEMERGLKSKRINPRDLKAKLAKKIVTLYYGEEAAIKAEKEFNKIFKEKKLPSKIPGFSLKRKKINILELLVRTGLVSSKSEARRLILQKGVKINGEIQKDWEAIITIKKGMVLQIGKRRFLKIV